MNSVNNGRGGHRLLSALADDQSASLPQVHEAEGGFLRRLLIALADASPAFTQHGTDDSAAARHRRLKGAKLPDTDAPLLLTVSEVATILRVSKMDVYRLTHSGVLEAIRIGGRFRVAAGDVARYYTEGTKREIAQAGPSPRTRYSDELAAGALVVQPRRYEDARRIGEQFRSGKPVIIDLREISNSDARRLVDFGAGLIFGLHGSIDKIGEKIFLLSPPDDEADAGRANDSADLLDLLHSLYL